MIDPVIVVNALNIAFLLIVIFLSIRITRAGTTYMWNQGNSDIQTPMKFRILKCLVAIIALGIGATIVNLLYAALFL